MPGKSACRTGEAELHRFDVKALDVDPVVSGGNVGTLLSLLRRDDLAVAYLL